MSKVKRQKVLKSTKAFGTIFLEMTVFMIIAILSAFIAMLPIFATMFYFEHYVNAAGFLIMIGGYMFYFIIAGYYGLLDDVMKDLNIK